jgi:hypothetical protein
MRKASKKMTPTTSNNERKIDATDVGLVIDAGDAIVIGEKINRAGETQYPVL